MVQCDVVYWLGGDFLGLGPSAWSCNGFERSRNVIDLDEYCSITGRGELPVCFSEILEGDVLVSERAILALRTRWGIRSRKFSALFGAGSLDTIMQRLEEIPSHLLKRSRGGVYLSREGMRVGNSIWQMLLP